jgi:hypothetical protein
LQLAVIDHRSSTLSSDHPSWPIASLTGHICLGTPVQ